MHVYSMYCVFFVLFFVLLLLQPSTPIRRTFILPDDILTNYVQEFNNDDVELYSQHISNKNAKDFLLQNIPLFECPDKDLERTYYFRWWTFRKHIKLVTNSPVIKRPFFVITEFLPNVSWAGLYNTISCAAGHHFREGRWLHDEKYLDDYSLFWAKEGNPRQYSFWFANSVRHRGYVTSPNVALITELLPGIVANFEAVRNTNFDPKLGLYFNTDNRDGMEFSAGGSEAVQGYRPTINSYQMAEAYAISKIFGVRGQLEKSAKYLAIAQSLHVAQDKWLWDNISLFYKVWPKKRKVPMESVPLVDVKELIGFTPWYFNIPSTEKMIAWNELMSRGNDGFSAPFGLTTCEQGHVKFALEYSKLHECRWNGPVWPYATSMTLTALGNVLNSKNYPPSISGTNPTVKITRTTYFEQMLVYAKSHTRVREIDNKTVSWIDENLHPYTGDWISRTLLKTWVNGTWSANKGGMERGKDYNHATFADLVITGIVGLRPRATDVLVVNPLIPDNVWAYFCLDQIKYRGRWLTILWDSDGKRYGHGAGLKVFVGGQLLASSACLSKLRVQLPPLGPDKM